ncbi:hypothetical protein GRZ55_22725 [Chelativorans sp. ZYF759]|uniref:hypothetical protein n=1 Tax=Chelativorans sp. ZYF759 TaxID=2692213 RepID=UPI00145C40FC|nr:hypothetical protein [Chelativorans sp. ZYF759]NMG42039.1 hypothetical protein [Chelativorans sp. ZYF759]
MIETLLFASALSSCIEREARTFEELVTNRGQSIVECGPRSYTEVAVYQSFSLDSAGTSSVRFEFVDIDADTVAVHEISPCRDFDLGEEGIGESLVTEIHCNGRLITLMLGPGSLQIRADADELFSYPIDSRYVIVNEMLYELAHFAEGE